MDSVRRLARQKMMQDICAKLPQERRAALASALAYVCEPTACDFMQMDEVECAFFGSAARASLDQALGLGDPYTRRKYKEWPAVGFINRHLAPLFPEIPVESDGIKLLEELVMSCHGRTRKARLDSNMVNYNITAEQMMVRTWITHTWCSLAECVGWMRRGMGRGGVWGL